MTKWLKIIYGVNRISSSLVFSKTWIMAVPSYSHRTMCQPLTANKLVALYQELISRPSPVEASIKLLGESVVSVTAKWSQRSLEKSKVVNCQASHLVNVKDSTVQHASSADVSSELFSRYSQSGGLKCVLTEGEKKKQFLQIWENSGRLLKTVDVAALDLHGDIYPAGDFGSMDWSPNEQQIVYVAEKKRPKPEPFFSPKPLKSEDGIAYGEEYTYIEDWGEQMTGQSQSVLVLYDLNSGASVLGGIPDGYCPGQVIWDKSGTGVYGVVYKNTPRRLGMIYCTNREGHVFHLSLNGEFATFTDSGVSPRSVRLSPDGETLIWLQRAAAGPHNSCSALFKMNITSGVKSELVPIVQGYGDGFPGIYKTLPTRCFSSNEMIYFDTISSSKSVIYKLNIDNGSLDKTVDGELLDVFNNHLVYVLAKPNYYPQLVLRIDGEQVFEKKITEGHEMKNVEYTESIVKFPVENVEIDKFNIILICPKVSNGEKWPLIVFPHGGPHGANFSTFMLEPAFFAELGCAVLLINYRGSLGAGDQSVNSLLGKIGALDVGDVKYAVDKVLRENENIDGEKVVAYGGSHGGFLSLQLAGQYPDIFKCVVVRNPVVELSSMFATSDIPDWISAEIGSTYNPYELPSSSDYEKMTEMSPIKWIESYKAPTLFLCGKNDQRVPMSQSIYYHRLLKANSVKTKLHIYPDNHALSTVPVHVDALINSSLWIHESIGTN